MAKKQFIGIKNLWYTEPLATAPTQETISQIVESAKEVECVHQGTWGYSQDDPSTTDYINEMTGLPYYIDKESAGNKTIAFTIGEYDYEDKAALQGGEVIKSGETIVGWKSSGPMTNIEKCIIALTKTGRYIVFTNALLVGKTDTQEKNLGLGVSAIAMQNTATGVADEYWFDAPNA